jgi:hypothetical protein
MFKKVSDIIELLENYHISLSEYFLLLETEVEDERVILLLEYVSKGEAFMAEYLEKYRKATPNRIMNSWVKYVPWLPTDIFCECRQNLKMHKIPDTYDVMEAVLHFDECLINFYTTLVQEIQNESVAEIFSNLLMATKKHEMNLSRDISWLHDL